MAAAATAGAGSADGEGYDAPDPGQSGMPARPVPGIDNGFLAGYRVRFDEAGADGLVRTGSLLRYAQDIAWRHSEDRGFDRRWYTDRGRWWVVRSIDLEIHAAVPMGRILRLATAVVGHRRIWARRRGGFELPDGSAAATIHTDWVIVDERGRIGRIPPEFGEAFPNPEIDGEIIRVEPPPPPPDAVGHELRVRPQDIDPMGHVNNAIYLDWAEEALRARSDGAAGSAVVALPRRWRAEYAASAEPGDALHASTWTDGTAWWVLVTRIGDDAAVFRAVLATEQGA